VLRLLGGPFQAERKGRNEMGFKSQFLKKAASMNKAELEQAFMRLGQLLRERQITAEIAVFGGAAIILGFDFRTVTQDVDVIITRGHGQVMKAQEEVGSRWGSLRTG